MKARVKKEDVPAKQVIRVSGVGPYHGHPIRLTIGMIVKNEEKTLDRCLSSLKPLMEAVESELIITDTGSTDRTVEIARKYTDHIIRFEWCGDFSAARNTGLKAARGEWFLFIDGDEWFESTDGLVEFFKSGECDRYGSAAYVIRNYRDFKGKTYAQFFASRIFRMYPDIHFQNIVHESIARMAPTKFLDDYAHHYGYVFRGGRERRKKYDRNLELLKRELEEDPDRLGAYCQLSRQYLEEDAGQAEKYCKLGLQAEHKHPNRASRLSLQQLLVQAYHHGKKYERLLDLVDKIVREDPKTEVLWLDFYGCAQFAAFSLGDYERSIGYGKAYLQTYEQYRAGRLDLDLTLVAIPAFNRPKHREEVLCLLGEAGLRLDRPEKAEEILARLDLSDPETVERDIALACRTCAENGRWEQLPGFYQKACSAGEEALRPMRRALEGALPGDAEKREAAACALAALPDDGDAYVRMNRLRKAERGKDRDAALRELNWFLRRDGEWDLVFSDVIFYGMKERLDLTPLMPKIDADDLPQYALGMEKRHEDFPEIVKEYFQVFPAQTVRQLFWFLRLQERVVVSEGEGPESENAEYLELFEEYARQSARYVRMLYRPELLTPDCISVFPRMSRFGYYMGLAFEARGKRDSAAYLSNLRLALHSDPVMERPVSLLLERFRKEEEQRKQKTEEFNVLAKQVKERIRVMLAQGKLEEAGRVTVQLAALLPNDPDVVRFRALTHMEPDMNELAAHLPQ